MDVSDDDSLFDFFTDVPRAKSHAREICPTPADPLKTAPSAGCWTYGSQIRNVTVESERQIQTHTDSIFSEEQEIFSDDFSTAAPLHSPSLEIDDASVPEYEDDFESTPSETSESYPAAPGREDSRDQGGSTTDSSIAVNCSKRRYPTQMSPGHTQHNAARNICNGDRSTRGCYHVTTAAGKQSAERRSTDRRLLRSGDRVSGRKAGYKDERFDVKNTIQLTSSRSRKRGCNQHCSSSGTNSESGRVKDVVDSELSLDTSSDVASGNCADIRLNNFSEKSVNMASRNKLSLPSVDRCGRIQLTKHRGERSTGHRATGHHGNKASSKQPRTYVSVTGRDNVRSGFNRRQSRKPAVPIPLKSEATYCDGELSVNVRGDRRGNPDKNKFNVTITVIHKHTKSRPTPYLSRETRQPRVLQQSRPIDWNIIQHRAVFPGFNTSTDPEVNRRYLQQFGL